jgi:hypothetical protein
MAKIGESYAETKGTGRHYTIGTGIGASAFNPSVANAESAKGFRDAYTDGTDRMMCNQGEGNEK